MIHCSYLGFYNCSIFSSRYVQTLIFLHTLCTQVAYNVIVHWSALPNRCVSVFIDKGLIAASFLVSHCVIGIPQQQVFPLRNWVVFSSSIFLSQQIKALLNWNKLLTHSTVYQVNLRFSLLSWRRLLCRSTLLLSSSLSTLLLKVLKTQKKS